MTRWSWLLTLALFGCATQKSAVPSAQDKEPQAEATAVITPEQNEAILRLFDRKASELQHCWVEEYERTHNRKVEGDVTLQVMVAPSGKAADVKILKSTIANPPIEECVSKAVESWHFPEGPAMVPFMRTVHLGAQF